MQLTPADFNMATDFEQLSSWGKDVYLDISGKMITAGIPPGKFEGGVLKQHTLLGQWLIKELDMKEIHLNAAAPDCMVFIQPGGAETNTWKLVWLVKAVSVNPIQGIQYVHHSISNFPGPQLIVHPESKQRTLVFTQL